MARYHLRAEDLRVNPWPSRALCWHVARVGEPNALCTRPLDPATRVRPVQDADQIPERERCMLCWERAFADLRLVG